MPRFDGQVALVTGAARGLGLAYATLLAERGAHVVVHDVGADRDGCHGLVEGILHDHGRLDALVHNAGWVAYQNVEAVEPATFARMMAIATEAPLWLAQAAWPGMQARGFERIVLTTSDRAIFPGYVQKGLAAYAAAKLAALGLVHALATEGAEYDIVVNAVSPVARTRMWGETGKPDDLRPEAVAPGVAFLASAACTEGGWVLRASNGVFRLLRAAEEAGVDYPRDLRGARAGSPEEVAAAWPGMVVAAGM